MYRTRAVGALFFDNLRRHHLFFLAGALGLALGVAVLVFFVGLGFGLKKHVARTLLRGPARNAPQDHRQRFGHGAFQPGQTEATDRRVFE